MDLKLERIDLRTDCTIGSLSIDGQWQCWILEDVVREVKGQPVAAWKIPGETAIPYGRYAIDITMSARFKRLLPILINVPGYSGVRIHPGNVAANTDGCLLPGADWHTASVGRSALAFDALFAELNGAKMRGQPMNIEIV